MEFRSTFRQRAGFVVLVSVLLLFFQNCDPIHSGLITSGSSLLDGFTLEVDPALQAQALGILSNRCASCHDSTVSGGVTKILDVNHLIASGLITPGNPNAGRLIGSIEDGSMPPGAAMPATETQALKDWISSMRLVGNVPPPDSVPAPVPAGKTVRPDAVLHPQAMNVLNTYCAGCHQSQGVNAGGGIDNILDVVQLVRSGLVTVGDSTKGRLLGSIVDGSMPLGNGARVPAADQQTLRNWINSLTLVDDVGQPKPATRAALNSTYTGVYANVIQPKCLACHGPVRALSGRNYATYNSVFGDRNNIRQECQSGGMPDRPYPRLTTDEFSALNLWIQNGALNN